MRKRATIIVTGVVQSVGFRAYTIRQARALGVCGYVRNLASGAVEIVSEGSEDTLQRLIEWAGRGPPLSRVEDVVVEFADPTGEFSDFSVEY
jgi:acylphosphatase